MNQTIAIGVVLLPPPDIMYLAIEANRTISVPGAGYALNTMDTLPHITLLQCFISEDSRANVQRILTEMAAVAHPLSLKVGMIQKEEFDGKMFYSFGIEKTKEIQSLHEHIIQMLSPYVVREGSRQHSFSLKSGETEVVQGTYDWVHDFVKLHSHAAFDPHITIGIGRAGAVIELPPQFYATTFALYQLGNHNTCRKMLASWELHSSSIV